VAEREIESEVDHIVRLEAEVVLKDAEILALAEEVESLQKAMESRAVIEQAKGVLMSTMRIGADAAFAVLVAASQRENVKLRDIATRIAEAQSDPAGPTTSDTAPGTQG
jgi:AmiR/NasT family two-component response regulator